MIAVIFELTPKKGLAKEYFDIAEQLRPLLTDVDGFISIERFESLQQPGKYLSLSFWQNETAINEWRNITDHRLAQVEGRSRIFQDYRLRVAQVDRDYGLAIRQETPFDSKQFHK